MKKTTFLFSLLLVVFSVKGQNLVPNGDFEGHSGCPTIGGQINLAVNWIMPTTGTSDYFNQCATNAGWSVPDNLYGYQNAHSGNAYGGLIIWFGNVGNYREYIETPITTPLVANNCYHFEMYVSLADICTHTSDGIGIYFSDTLVSGITNYNPLPFIPQIINTTGIFPDTLNWILITGNYSALGGENYLIIGNFKDDSNTSTLLVNGAGYNAAELYIDDVSLTPCTGINENIKNAALHISQNPVSNNLQISGTIQSSEAEINLIDVTGRICFHKKIFSKGDFNVNINVSDFSDGIYILNLRDGGQLFSRKVVIRR
jgi:hypothetical protein